MFNGNNDNQDPLLSSNPSISLVVIGPAPIYTQHKATIIYECPECPKTFMLKCELARHSYVHVKEKKFLCDLCPKKFKSPRILQWHKKCHKIDDKTYECEICSQKFPNSFLFKCHVNKYPKTQTCTQCGSKFHNKKDLEYHEFKYHTNVKYYCYICKEDTTDTSTLLKHIEDEHDITTSEFQCEFCGKILTNQKNLKQHIGVIHRELLSSECSICGYKTLFPSSLEKHMHKHTLEKPDLCTVCGKRFSKGHLRVHMVVHTGEKPHKCKYCEKRFTQHGSLKIHMRAHTGEKPYKCDYCENKFISSYALKNHIKTKHDRN